MRDDASLDYARVVQLGWNVGEASMDVRGVMKTFLVRPRDFEVSEKATKKCHGITHERAVRESVDLALVLQDFMKDVREACSRGGRICAHQLELLQHHLNQPACCMCRMHEQLP